VKKLLTAKTTYLITKNWDRVEEQGNEQPELNKEQLE